MNECRNFLQPSLTFTITALVMEGKVITDHLLQYLRIKSNLSSSYLISKVGGLVWVHCSFSTSVSSLDAPINNTVHSNSAICKRDGCLGTRQKQQEPREQSGVKSKSAAASRSAQQDNVSRAPRSEERRVGKECRSRWSTYH